MNRQNAIKVFEQKKIRSHWDDEQEKWYFSVVDVVGVLTESPNPRKYWSVLKTRLKKEGSELATNCSQLKMTSSDGKYYKTNVTSYWYKFKQHFKQEENETVTDCNGLKTLFCDRKLELIYFADTQKLFK